jgi:putative transposase
MRGWSEYESFTATPDRQSNGRNPHSLVADKLRTYGAAMKVVGNADKQETGRWLNNRAENSHQPFRRRERAMIRFRRMRTLQKFVAVHASIHTISI